MAKHEWSLDELRHKAEAYCASAEHCSYEVSNKLQQWGANTEAIASIIAHLKSQRYIDDERYCRAFAHDKLLYQGWGRLKIQAALYAKHIATSYINQALDTIDPTEYLNTLKRIIATKKRTIKSSDPMAREKLIRFCLQRGFTYDEILPLL
jgi:regulatory protein